MVNHSFAQTSVDSLLTPEELTWLKLNKININYAPNPSWFPGEYIDEKGIHKGIVSDYLKNFEEKLNIKFNSTIYEDWPEMLLALKTKKTDFVGAIQQTPERDSFLLFTDVFLEVPLVLIVRKDIENDIDSFGISKMKLSVVKDYTSTDYAQLKYPYAEFYSSNDDLTALLKTSLGTTDGTVTDLMVSSYLIEKYGITNLKIGKVLDYTWHLRFAVRNDMPELRSILNKLLSNISPEERKQIYQKWIILKEIPPQSFIEKYYRSIVVGIISLIIISFILILTNFFLRKQVRKKTAELSKELLENIKSKKIIERNELRLESLLRISNYKAKTQKELLDYALNEAIELTSSKIGYLLFYDEKSKIFNLSNWSKTVMSKCMVNDIQSIFYLEKAGFWGEAIRQRQPVINNNFKDFHPKKKGQPEGHIPILKFLAIPVFDDDEIIATVGVGNKEDDYDKTDIRQLSLLMSSVWKIFNRQKWQEELVVAKNKAEESNQLKSAFLANLSHEIRTPMNGIMGFASFFKNKELPSDLAKRYSEIIIKSSEQLLQIVNDIVDISKIETNQIELSKNIINLSELLNDIYMVQKPLFKSKNIDFIFEYNLAKDIVFISDDTKIRQVLNNLIGNAAKFTHHGYVKLSCWMNIDKLEFCIEDSGIGITSDLHEKIFERFRQGEVLMSRKYGGMGLGLSISKGFVELLGGNIWVESELNKGSKFYFTLPYRKSTNIISNINSDKTTPLDLSNFSILIVEDEEYNLMFLLTLLDETNANIITARDGAEAVQLVEKYSFDLVLMDIKLPNMNGIDATKKIKQRYPELPIIAQTAYAQENDKLEALAAGCDDFITKPINTEKFDEIIQKHLNLEI